MSETLQTIPRHVCSQTQPDPTCLIWGFNPSEMHFLSQMLTLTGFHFTTSLSPPTTALHAVIAAQTADPRLFPQNLPVIPATFSRANPPAKGNPVPAALSQQRTVVPRATTSQTNLGVAATFQLPRQIAPLLAKLDQCCYPPRGQVINVFGVEPGVGASTIAFGLANSAKNSLYVDAASQFISSRRTKYAKGPRKLGFSNVPHFSSLNIASDLLVSRLRMVLPHLDQTRFLQLDSRHPPHVSRILSLLIRSFSLVVVDWGQLQSSRNPLAFPGKTLVVHDYQTATHNPQTLRQLHRQGVLLVNNRASKLISTSGNRKFSLPHCRELKRLQAQGLGSQTPPSFKTHLARLLQEILEDGQ